MSHSSHRNAVRDASRPLQHRASHARSCALHVAARLGTTRDQLIELVREHTGANLFQPQDENELLRAFEYMEAMHTPTR